MIGCGKAVGSVGKTQVPLLDGKSVNRFRDLPQVFPIFSTRQATLSTAAKPILSTFPQNLLLQLYILTNPYYLDGELRRVR